MEIRSPQEIAEKIVELCMEKGVSVNRMLSDCNLNKSVVDNLKEGLPGVGTHYGGVVELFRHQH